MNNNSQTIKCPKCKASIPLNTALTDQIKEKLKSKFEKENQRKEQEIKAANKELKKREEEINNKKEEIQKKFNEEAKMHNEKLLRQRKELEKEKAHLNQTVEAELKKQSQIFQKEALIKAKKELNMEMEDLKNQNQEQAKKMEEFQKNELELRRKQRELQEEKKNLNLEMERKLDKEKEKIINQTKEELSEETRKQLSIKDQQMIQMRKTIEDLKRKSEQGSMQIQGDAQEEELKELLKRSFPTDVIKDVPTGVKGGDLIQTVNSKFGQECGIVLIESKNTKNWSDDWIKKLKGDQGLAKADTCFLITRTLPDSIKTFGIIEGVFVCSYQFSLPLLQIVRNKLIELNSIKQANVGKSEKLESLYEYLSGSQFKNRIENIVMAFTSMKKDLETEKRSMQRIWSKREKEIERVITNTSGMYGDLEGIMGNQSLPEVKSLMLEE